MLEQDPRISEGPTFFGSLYGWMKRVAVDVNNLWSAVAGHTSTLAGKVDRAGDTMTGALNLVGASTAATQAASDNSTKIATTAWNKLGFAISSGAAGYVKFPDWLGGFILQWGASVLAGASASVSYPLAFPNNVRAGVCCPGGGAPASGTVTALRLDNNSSMTLFNVSGGALTIYWLVVGV